MKRVDPFGLPLISAALAFFFCGMDTPETSLPAHTGLFASADTAETAFLKPAGMVRLDKTTKTLQGIVA